MEAGESGEGGEVEVGENGGELVIALGVAVGELGEGEFEIGELGEDADPAEEEEDDEEDDDEEDEEEEGDEEEDEGEDEDEGEEEDDDDDDGSRVVELGEKESVELLEDCDEGGGEGTATAAAA